MLTGLISVGKSCIYMLITTTTLLCTIGIPAFFIFFQNLWAQVSHELLALETSRSHKRYCLDALLRALGQVL